MLYLLVIIAIAIFVLSIYFLLSKTVHGQCEIIKENNENWNINRLKKLKKLKKQKVVCVICLIISICITIGFTISLSIQIKDIHENKIMAQQAFKDKDYSTAKEYYGHEYNGVKYNHAMEKYCRILGILAGNKGDLEQDGYVDILSENYWNDAITKIDSIKDTLDDEVVTPEQAEAVKKEIQEYVAKAKKCNKNKTREQDEEIKRRIDFYDILYLTGFESKYLKYHKDLAGCRYIKIDEQGDIFCKTSGSLNCYQAREPDMYGRYDYNLLPDEEIKKIHYDYKLKFYTRNGIPDRVYYCNNEGYVVAS